MPQSSARSSAETRKPTVPRPRRAQSAVVVPKLVADGSTYLELADLATNHPDASPRPLAVARRC